MTPELRMIVIATRQRELRAEADAHRLARRPSVESEPAAGSMRPGLLRRAAGSPSFS